MTIRLELADEGALIWAQSQVSAHHYLHSPVDSRCSVLGYVLMVDGERAGCLLFGRPESTRCYQGGLTYGSGADVTSGRATFDRWEIVNTVPPSGKQWRSSLFSMPCEGDSKWIA